MKSSRRPLPSVRCWNRLRRKRKEKICRRVETYLHHEPTIRNRGRSQTAPTVRGRTTVGALHERPAVQVHDENTIALDILFNSRNTVRLFSQSIGRTNSISERGGCHSRFRRLDQQSRRYVQFIFWVSEPKLRGGARNSD